MKKLLALSVFLFSIYSCGYDKKEMNADSMRIDSALKAQQNNPPPAPTTRSLDTTHMVALPPVIEGDLLFQNVDNEQMNAFGAATHSKYNNVGLIFLRPKDNQYMVLDGIDSVHTMLLSDWVARGKGQHVALVRLKEANLILTDKKTTSLKTGSKAIRGKKYDMFFSWSDEALYPSEMVWKIYKNAGNVTLCELGKLSQFDLSGPLVKQQMKNKYGTAIPMEEKAVSPEDLYKSPKLEVIFER